MSPARSRSMRRSCRIISPRKVPDFACLAVGQAIQGRAIQSDLSAGNRQPRNTCCGGSRRASCCPPRMRSIANSASSARCMRKAFRSREPVLYCSDESVAGTAFYVMDFVDGRVFWEPQMPGSNPAERAAVYDDMNAALARLHSASIRPRSACRISARARIMSRGRSTAGRSNIARRRPKRFRKWTG